MINLPILIASVIYVTHLRNKKTVKKKTFYNNFRVLHVTQVSDCRKKEMHTNVFTNGSRCKYIIFYHCLHDGDKHTV